MGLFQTLHSTSTGGAAAGAASSTSSFRSLELPTVVQLFCDHEPLQFHYQDNDDEGDNNNYSYRNKNHHKNTTSTSTTTTSLVPPWACLSYQTVDTGGSGVTTGRLRTGVDAAVVSTPLTTTTTTIMTASPAAGDLGVWNVRVFANNSNTSMDHSLLFQIPVRERRKFGFTLDLSSPSSSTQQPQKTNYYSKVEPWMTRMQQALVRFLIASSSSSSDQEDSNVAAAPPSTTTTTTTTTTPNAEAEQKENEDKTVSSEDAPEKEGEEGEGAAKTSTTSAPPVVVKPQSSSVPPTPLGNETTSLYQLRTVQFGLAPEREPNQTESTTNDEADKHVKVALLITVLLPEKKTKKMKKNKNKKNADSKDPAQESKPQDKKKEKKDDQDDDDDDDDDEDYQAKQTRALLIYHLRRYAMLLNCALVFVNPAAASSSLDEEEGDEERLVVQSSSRSSRQGTGAATVSLSQTALLWRAFALGQPIWNDYASILELKLLLPTTTVAMLLEQELDQEEGDNHKPSEPAGANSSSTMTPLVFGPGSYQQELLDTVLLRNAHNPGHWDAAKEDLWTILPYDDDDNDNNSLNNGDETSMMRNATMRIKTMMDRTGGDGIMMGGKSGAGGGGDQAWLLELRDSMANVTMDSASSVASVATTSGTSVTSLETDAASSSNMTKGGSGGGSGTATPAKSLLPDELLHLASSPTPQKTLTTTGGGVAGFQTPEPSMGKTKGTGAGKKPPKSEGGGAKGAAAAATPAASSKKGGANKNSATPGANKDTAAFFESLLK
ncbi:hypothetical protein ACA910_018456 [Epithemia clementina (nom. ined.)]